MLAVFGPLLSLVGREAGELQRKLQRQAIFWGLLAVLAAVIITFLLVALLASLSTVYGPVIAPLIIAAGALLLAILVVLIFQLLATLDARETLKKRHDNEMTALVTTAALTAIPMLLRSPLLKEIGIPIGAALASVLWFKKGDDTEPPPRGGRRPER
jgi:predicted tellurium resistance membrane protein TerC